MHSKYIILQALLIFSVGLFAQSDSYQYYGDTALIYRKTLVNENNEIAIPAYPIFDYDYPGIAKSSHFLFVLPEENIVHTFTPANTDEIINLTGKSVYSGFGLYNFNRYFNNQVMPIERFVGITGYNISTNETWGLKRKQNIPHSAGFVTAKNTNSIIVVHLDIPINNSSDRDSVIINLAEINNSGELLRNTVFLISDEADLSNNFNLDFRPVGQPPLSRQKRRGAMERQSKR